jgi:hypothetical protein
MGLRLPSHYPPRWSPTASNWAQDTLHPLFLVEASSSVAEGEMEPYTFPVGRLGVVHCPSCHGAAQPLKAVEITCYFGER